ncbi:MAG: copper resistance protein NlpE N-terminal domain-containing protein, partial [Bacteroidaceae bacterium]|nr:copper resistance protein NlpE N-terminal domain-containing protein [Bacteroidaceae bacterium]
ALGNVVLAFRTISLNDDGTYSITTDYVDEGLVTQTDNGEAIIIMGMSGDSTVTFLELVSANEYPTMRFRMQKDSSLVKVDSVGKPASSNPSHKLTIKK